MVKEIANILISKLPNTEQKPLSVPHLGILLSLALILQMVEGMLPPLGLPGVKLGLANIVILLSLQFLGWRTALVLVILRQIVAGFLLGRLLSVGFLLSLSGGLASILTMQLWLTLGGWKGGLAGTSIAGALGHNWGQWIIARWIINHQGIVWYLPFLILAALPCGLLVASISNQLIKIFVIEHSSTRLITKKAFIILMIPIFLAVGLPFTELIAKPNDAIVIVEVDGETELELDICQNGSWDFTANDYQYTLIIEKRGVQLVKSNCRDQICVQTGTIIQVGQSIICLPGKLVIYIQNNSVKTTIDGYLY